MKRTEEQQSVIKFWEKRGFLVSQTGGGCEAFIRRNYNPALPEAFIMITAADDPSLPESMAHYHCIGFYENANDDAGSLRESPDAHAASVLLLALLFLRELEATIGTDDYQEVIALNAAESDDDICHSHDFCDANMVMAAAWEQAGNPEIDLQNDRHTAHWGDAWTVAKLNMQS